MRKRTLISAAMCAALLAGGMPAAASAPHAPTHETGETAAAGRENADEVMAINVTEVTEMTIMPGAGESVDPGVPESELTRKMIQAEKARNAEENDGYGIAITIIAMSIVLSALIILSILFLIFGKISASFQKERKRRAHGVSIEDAEDHHDELDSGEVIAAISMALAEHEGLGHDMEDTILTIRRMRKAYSPWNSKIYNLRAMPEHIKAQAPAKKN